MASAVGNIRPVGVLFKRIDERELLAQRRVSLPHISLAILESQVVPTAERTRRPDRTVSDLGGERMADCMVVEEVVRHSPDGVVQETTVPKEAAKTAVQEVVVQEIGTGTAGTSTLNTGTVDTSTTILARCQQGEMSLGMYR